LATFDYFKAIWKNGPGVVSDAPAWVLGEIERELPVWMAAHEHEFVGVHLCAQSDLVLGILVSPSASGGNGSLENARYGSFIHVFVTDHANRAALRVDEVGEFFESTYGAPISDGAVRQQRNFMLLDFPYHMDLAKDLFIDKDRVEGCLNLAVSEPSSAFEEICEEPVSPDDSNAPDATDAPHEEPASRPLPSGSLSSLLSHHDPVVPSRGPDGLPFDQGLSYEEVIAGLRERLYGKPSPPAEREHTVGAPPAPAAPVMRASFVEEAAQADAGVVGEEEETEIEPSSFDALPVLERIEPSAPRRAWSPIYAVAGLLVAGFLIGGVIAFRLWERAPVDASLAERVAPVAKLPDVSARSPVLPVLPAVKTASQHRVAVEVKPALTSIAPAMPSVIDEAKDEAELPVLAAVRMKSAPEAVVHGTASRLEQAAASVPIGQAPIGAEVEVATELEPATKAETSNASAESDPAFEVEVVNALLEPTGEILEESAATRPGETLATRSNHSDEAEADATSIPVKRETKQRDERRERARKRVMGQINRYR